MFEDAIGPEHSMLPSYESMMMMIMIMMMTMMMIIMMDDDDFIRTL